MHINQINIKYILVSFNKSIFHYEIIVEHKIIEMHVYTSKEIILEENS